MTDAPTRVDEPTETTDEPPESALDSDRYAHLSLDGGDVVIYDRHEPDTWVQSDFHVEVGV
jgi:hypothetical protein